MKLNHFGNVLLSIFISSCYPNHDYERNAVEYYTEPTTKQETEYFQQLKLLGLQLKEYSVPIRGRSHQDNRAYSLQFSSSNENDQEKMFQNKKDIANHLYSRIIEDSTIYDISQICISIDPFKKIKYIGENETVNCFCKDSLEAWNGFKVVLNHKGKFVRKKHH